MVFWLSKQWLSSFGTFYVWAKCKFTNAPSHCSLPQHFRILMILINIVIFLWIIHVFKQEGSWHKFMPICLCIAALCITNKHSLLPSELEGRQREKQHLNRGWNSSSSPEGEVPPGAFLRFPDTMIFAITPLSGHLFSCLGAQGPSHRILLSLPLAVHSPMSPLSSHCLSGDCSG